MRDHFKFIGVSEKDGQYSVRYSNTKGRLRTLERAGVTHVVFIEVEEPLMKEDCMDALLDHIQGGHTLESPAVDAIAEEATKLGFVVNVG